MDEKYPQRVWSVSRDPRSRRIFVTGEARHFKFATTVDCGECAV